MKEVFAWLSGAVMVVYTLYRAFTTVVFLPFAGTLASPTGIYFLLLVLLAAGATVLSFTWRTGMAAALASGLGFMALFYWWVIICRASIPIWSDFYWLVVPELFFALAGICKWKVCRRTGRQAEPEASAGS